MKFHGAIFLLFCFAPACAAAAVLTPDDYYKLASVAEPAFSPDGSKLVAVERRVDVASDKRRSSLVLTDVSTKVRRTLTFEREGVDAPAWSPSGDAIAFIANDAKQVGQIYVLPLAGGDARAITATAQGVQQFAWRPSGDSIAYVTSDVDPKKAAIAKHHDLFDLGNDDYLTRSYDPPGHIWLVPSGGGSARRLTSGPSRAATSYPPSPPASPLAWSPDGRSLLFTRVPNTRDGDAYASTIVRLDVATGELTPLTGHTRFEGFATYAPVGDKIAYLYSRDGDPNNEGDVYVTDAAGGPGIDVSRTLDRAIYRAQWYPDGKSLLVGAHDGARTLLWRLRLDGTYAPIDTAGINPTWSFWIDAALARDGSLAFPGSNSGRPTELYDIAADGTLARLTDLNAGVAAHELGNVREVTWENDGFHEDGVLVYPPHYVAGKRYPLVLNVHGGPQAASGRSFDFWSQTLAAHGWLVFEPNYRGSDNAGNAYERAIYMDAGAGPGRDVMAGVAAVEKLGSVDTSRIAIGGWSYGGYMTSWLMTHYHVWRTAISGAAVNNWVDMYDLGDANYQIGFAFKGSPYVGTNMRDYLAQSPITYAAQTSCPVLVISDVGDVRVPISQSFEMYHALADNHIPVRFVGIPVDGHFPSDPVRTRDVLALWSSWFAAHLK
jgi:dipeptidyl aminopeptidase/acylaminoacyl peptidase